MNDTTMARELQQSPEGVYYGPAEDLPILREGEGKSIPVLGTVFYLLYAIPLGTLRRLIRKLCSMLEKGQVHSRTLRRIFSRYEGVEIGMYSYGCFNPFQFRHPTRIGRYCSIYVTVRAFNANHPMNLKSTHPFFYNPKLEVSKEQLIEHSKLEIGNDVFIGHNSIILPSVTSIGDGAVVAAGSVVNKNIPPYGVVVGNPARLIRFRFPPDEIKRVMASRWWERPIDELRENLAEFQRPLDGSDTIR